MKKFFIIFILALIIIVVIFVSQQRSVEIGKCEDCNVIVFVLDALRTDHMSLYGYYRNTTTNIDKFADKGIVFENAFSQSFNTLPSVTSLFTSTYPSSHGVYYVYKDTLNRDIPTLPRILKNYDYKTAAFSPSDDPYTNHILADFDEGHRLVPYYEFEDNYIFDWLENNSEEKFFLYYHTYNIHAPYLVTNDDDLKIYTRDCNSEIGGTFKYVYNISRDKLIDYYYNDSERFFEYFDRNFIDGLNLSSIKNYTYEERWEIILENPQQRKLKKFFHVEVFREIFKEDHVCIKSLYDTKIYLVDQFLNRIFEKIDELNLTKKTIIIITADHGEALFDHGEMSHTQLYDEVLHIPLIVKTPDIKNKIVVEGLAESVDIMPTILDVLGIPVNHVAQGKSLLLTLNRTMAKEYVYASFGEDYTIRSKDWKLYRHGDWTELYDIKNDPDEMINVAEVRRDVVRSIMNRVLKLPNYKTRNSTFNENLSSEEMMNIIKTGYW
ncbi:MAG: sulfatase [Candidatus Aenigmatarchaeota archaeon]